MVLISDNGAYADHFKVITSSAVVFDNSWHLVGFTWNSGTLTAYVDGLASGAMSGPATGTSIYNSTADITIGCGLSTAPAMYFSGLLDEARLYNAAIPTSQIKEQYYAGLNSLLASGGISKEEYNQRVQSLSLND